MKTLYFDCASGISGDMTVAALLDLGADEAVLRKQLATLGVSGYTLAIGKTLKNGISATRFDVQLEDHQHHHVGLREIREILTQSGMTEAAKKIATEIFEKIAQVEGKIHGKSSEEVHFHEVGAVDSIVDIAATAICLDQLTPDQILFSKIREGSGTVTCAHGILPVPVPATLALLSDCGAELTFCDVQGEMVTPTGAGIAACMGQRYGVPCPSGRVVGIGYGAGAKDFPHANVLRVILVETERFATHDLVCELQTQVDDMTGEELGFAMERLFAAGCLDVFYTPIQMKKNRPGILLTALCRIEDETKIEETIFAHTTTFGVRKTRVERLVLARETSEVNGVPVKTAAGRWHPEYEAVAALARESGKPLREIIKHIGRNHP